MGVTAARRDEVAEVLRRVRSWAGGRGDVEAVALVGSWARGAERMTSDVDLVVLTREPDACATAVDRLAPFGAPPVVRTRRWGALLERRVRLDSGLEVEFGFAPPTWAGTSPIDPGTRRVATDGLRVLHDPRGLLADLVRELSV